MSLSSLDPPEPHSDSHFYLTSSDSNNASLKGTVSDRAGHSLPSLYFTLNSAGTIVSVNADIDRWGYTTETLLGQPIRKLFHSADPAQLQRQLRSLDTSSGEYTLAGKQGISVSLTVQHLHSSDRHAALLLVCQPLSSESQAEISTKQAEFYHQIHRVNVELERQVHARTAELQLAFEFEATLKRITDKVRDSFDESQILQTAVQELAETIGVKCCNAALFDLQKGTSTVCYEYTTSVSPYLGRVSDLKAFPEIYTPLLQGQSFQFCSLVPNPKRGRVATLTCPILDNQGVLGDLWLINHSFYAFNEQDIRLVRQVANQCAIAIRLARLYQAAQTQVQELEKLNRLKDDFLSTVSHELRTPMSSIKMAAQMLEIVLKQAGIIETVPPIDRYVKILQQECQREITLIDNLLVLSHLEQETQPLRSVAIDLNTWLPALLNSFCDRAEQQQQHLHFKLAPELPPLQTDAGCLERILAELLHNACKYTPAGEEITLSVQVQSTEAGRVLELCVANSGIEIQEAERSRIFEKFYRVPTHDRWRYGGTGLGLALVKELVARLGASIAVTSQNRQTTFTISFLISGPVNQLECDLEPLQTPGSNLPELL